MLLSDGNETRGNAFDAATQSETEFFSLPYKEREEPEIQVAEIHVPERVATSEPFNVEAIIRTNHPDTVIVDLFRSDFRVDSRQVDLKSGQNDIQFSQQVDSPAQFTVQIRPPDDMPADGSQTVFRDTFVENNEATGVVFTTGRPRGLIIDSQADQIRPLQWALDEQDIDLEIRPPQGMPKTLAELQKYDLLILSNAPAKNLTEEQMNVVRTYVSDLGGGLIMLGSDQSFGLGGYYRTTIEEILPVTCDFEKEREKPGIAMVLIIDKSGSMGGRKMELAKDAAKGTVELLNSKDQIGVIAFDGSPYWVSQVRPLTQKGVVLDQIAAIQDGGGTVLYPAMQQAYQSLLETSSKLKHVIILTDGRSAPGDFTGLTKDMISSRITVSTVGIGDADQETLQQIAEIGNGRYYFSDDPSSVPQIFARETIMASKSAIQEEPFLPLLVRSTKVLADVNVDEAPFLMGFVVTRPKPTSEVIMTTETGEPLLSWWRYGLGMSAAFTSDARVRWAAEWVSWEGYSRFWAQVFRHCMRKQSAEGLQLEVLRQDNTCRVVVESSETDGRFVNDAMTALQVVDPGGETQTIELKLEAPGRYECEFDCRQRGAWQLHITQQRDDGVVRQRSQGFVVGVDKELQLKPPNTQLLKELAEVTQGRYNCQPSDVFRDSEDNFAWRRVPLWPWLVSAAAVLLVLDVALRRVDLRTLVLKASV